MDSLRAGLREAAVLAPGVSVFNPGVNRFGFALFDPARAQLTASAVAVYTARVDGSHVQGPYRARRESLAVDARFQSTSVVQDPSAAQSVWVADVPLRRGKQLITALAQVGGRRVVSTEDQLDVLGGQRQPPNVGQPAIAVHTPTLASVHGDAAKIDTRVPPARDLLSTDLVAVLGKRPVVLVFATPLLCQSRTCGPVVDIEEQVASELGGGASFIHVEVYRNNNVASGNLPQLVAWRLPTEPWTFVIDRHGIVRSRFEGPLSTDELRAAVSRVIAAR